MAPLGIKKGNLDAMAAATLLVLLLATAFHLHPLHAAEAPAADGPLPSDRAAAGDALTATTQGAEASNCTYSGRSGGVCPRGGH
jgi:hypothetical protein